MSAAQSEHWRALGERAGSRFEARPSGLHGYQLAAVGGGEFGRLELHGLKGARFRAGDLEAGIARRGIWRLRYGMTSDGEEILRAGTERFLSGIWRAEYLGRGYRIRPGLLKREASVSSASGEEIARISGRSAGRSYEISLNSPGAMPVVIFAVYQIIALQRRAYLTGRL